ncbi:MAG: hypothetical protein QM778_23950 [Myxococcales bacterium]
MGETLAAVVIGLWIPFTFFMFGRYPAQRAALYCYFGGMLVLPNWVGIKLPLFPLIEKANVVNLAMLLVLAFKSLPGLRKPEAWWYVAALGTLFSTVLTGYTNQDPIYFAASPTFIPGLGFKDTGAVVIGNLLSVAPASYLGMRLFRRTEDLRLIARVMVVCGLIYSIPILLEIRLSPQMHRWVYGYAGPHEWAQLMRYGGYRPLVMFGHGLVLSLFMLGPTMMATALARTGGRVWKVSANAASWYLTFIIIVCKSTGVWFYAVIVLPMLRLVSSRAVLRMAVVLCLLTCAYPWLRANQVIPTKDIIAKVTEFSPDRAQSLEVRFTNEDKLIVKAMERPWFGWGSYGRNRIYDEYGIDRCVTDGAWVMTLGSLGFVGFGFNYLFSVGAMLIAASRIARVSNAQDRNLMAGVLLMCAVMWFDTLPNAPDFTIAEFLAGALCSISAGVLAEQEKARFRKPQKSGAGAGGLEPSVARAS